MVDRTRESKPESKAFLARLSRIPLHLILWVFGSLLVSLILEWLLMSFVWYDQGAEHSRQVLIKEWGFINSHFTRAAFGITSPSEIAAFLAEKMHYWIFTWTGLESLLLSIGKFGNLIGEYINASLNITQVFFLRLSITIASLPLFVLFGYWGFFEGLVRRDLRRYGADYERGLLFSWAKYLTGSVIILPIIFYLTIPVTLNPALVFIPFAALLAIVLMVVSSTFTKYV